MDHPPRVPSNDQLRAVPSHNATRRSRLLGYDVGPYPLHEFTYDYATPASAYWPLRIDFAGRDTWVAGCYRKREHSDTFAVEWVTEGCFHFSQGGGGEYAVESGGVFLVQRGLHSTMRCEAEGFHRKRTVAMGGALLEPILRGVGLEAVDGVEVSDRVRLGELFDGVDRLLAERPEDLVPRGSALAYGLLMLLSESRRRSHLPVMLRKVLMYMEHHLRESQTVGALAEAFHVSPTTLHRMFRTYLDTTPMGHWIGLRMEAAKRLLRITGIPVKTVAYEVGYSNPLYFSNEFRRHTGQSPRAYRANRPPPAQKTDFSSENNPTFFTSNE